MSEGDLLELLNLAWDKRVVQATDLALDLLEAQRKIAWLEGKLRVIRETTSDPTAECIARRAFERKDFSKD